MRNAWDMSVSIPNIDAKDLFMVNNFLDKERNKTGYRLSTKDKKINYKKYIN